MGDLEPAEENSRPGAFPATRWTRVVALQADDPDKSRKALEDLCEIYWLPIYSYFRRAGRSSEDAKDLTQSLFEQMIRRGDFAKADSEKGKMRTFLLTIAKRHLASKVRSDSTVKRGGGQFVLSLDAENAEGLHAGDSPRDLSPERLFDRQWANVTLRQARSNLAEEYTRRGREKQYRVLRNYLSWNDNADVSYADASRLAGLTEVAFRAAVSRMRKRFQSLLREQIADTVLEGDDIDGEIRYLLSALS